MVLKKSFFIFALFCLALVLIGRGVIRKKIANFPISEVYFNESQVPEVLLDIEGKPYPAFLWLRAKYPLTLRPDVLSRLQKKNKGSGFVNSIAGEKRSVSLYQLKEAKLGGWKFESILTAASDDVYNAIEWPLEKLNILIDFPHQFVCGIRRKNDLHEMGLDLKKMTKIPCQISKKGIIFKAEMEGKPLTFSLLTSTNHSLIDRKKLSEEESKKIREITVKGHSLGSYLFCPFEITPELGIDILLGADFLKEHIVYIDAEKKQIYVGDAQGNHLLGKKSYKIPIQLLESGVPYLQLEMNENTYDMKIDLGFNREIFLKSKKETPKKFRKLDRKHLSCNVYGKLSESIVYLAEACHIGQVTIPNVLVNHASKSAAIVEVKSQTFGQAKDSEMDGLIGYSLLARSNVYLDIKRKIFQFTDTISSMDLDPNNFEKLPFHGGSTGLIHISAQTDFGSLNLLLDSGFPISVIKSGNLDEKDLLKDPEGNFCFISSTLGLGTCDWGDQKFFPLEITAELGEIDGILGVDFLRKSAVFIDFQRKEIWIEKP